MKFEEILPSFKEGKKIRERCWGKQQYIVIGPNETIVTENGLIILLHLAGLKADDWEIFEEEKKVKLRDLTEEQFEKWRDENCKKYDCFDCPFRCIDCNKFFWMSCKDMYSDKFLDQEVEIEEE